MLSANVLLIYTFFAISFIKIVFSLELNKKSVILIIVDDLRPAISEGYNDPYAKTPNIDKFVRKSHYFTKAYCQQALCAPSRNSMLTGRRPDTIRLYDFYNYWRTFTGNFTTLPQYFGQFNYTTYSIGKIFHPGISSNYTDDYPLSWTKKPFHPKTDQFMNAPVCPDESGELKANLFCPVQISSQPGKTLPDIETMQEAKRFLAQESGEKPFFLAIGFHKPHIPFRFPLKYLDEFPPEVFNSSGGGGEKPYGMPDVAWNPYTDIRKRNDFKHLRIPFPFGPIPKKKSVDIKRGYYSSVAYVDHLIGEVMKSIDFKKTVVIVTSDHGWSLGEHAEWAKYSNFEVALRVPLIVYSPEFEIKNGKEIKEITELIDLFPSLIDLAQLPRIPACGEKVGKKTCAEGKSFYQLLKNGKIDINKVGLSQYPRPGVFPTLHPNSDKPKLKAIKVMGYSMRTLSFRYTIWIEFDSKNFTKRWNNIYGEELYDHRIDRNELMNFANRDGFENLKNRLKKKLIKEFS